MHDILEGVASYVVTLLVCHCIHGKHYFSLEQLNTRIQSLDYGVAETSKPSPIEENWNKETETIW